MNVLGLMGWLQEHPGIVSLISKLPKFDKETAELLIKFLQHVVTYKDPEGYLKSVLKKALSEPIPTTVEVLKTFPRR